MEFFSGFLISDGFVCDNYNFISRVRVPSFHQRLPNVGTQRNHTSAHGAVLCPGWVEWRTRKRWPVFPLPFARDRTGQNPRVSTLVSGGTCPQVCILHLTQPWHTTVLRARVWFITVINLYYWFRHTSPFPNCPQNYKKRPYTFFFNYFRLF